MTKKCIANRKGTLPAQTSNIGIRAVKAVAGYCYSVCSRSGSYQALFLTRVRNAVDLHSKLVKL